MRTRERLARAMEEALCPAQMVTSARAGLYDDFGSDLAFPLLHLVQELKGLGQHALAQRVIEGEFDGTAADAEAWLKSDEGRAVIRRLTGGE